MAENPAAFPRPGPLQGSACEGSAFATFESLQAYYSRMMPAAYVQGLIEAEREVFVVRRECSLRETQIQFLRKCESALARALAEALAGRAAWDWSIAPPAS